MPILTLLTEDGEHIGEEEITHEELQFIEAFATARDMTFDEAYNHMIRVGIEVMLNHDDTGWQKEDSPPDVTRTEQWTRKFSGSVRGETIGDENEAQWWLYRDEHILEQGTASNLQEAQKRAEEAAGREQP